MRLIWYVALGSAIGGGTRYALTLFISQRAGAAFPYGTLLINITGSILLGFLMRYALATPAITPGVRALLTTGFCGGYTTFSTFSYETAALIEDGDYHRAAGYVLGSVLIALAGTFLGFAGARWLIAFRESV